MNARSKAMAIRPDVGIARVRTKVGDALNIVRTSAEQGVARLRSETREIADATDGYVRAHPWKAVGIAAGLGMLVAILSSRRGSG